jgi:hypothetical protein
MGSLSKFPNGFNSGLAVRGVTVLNSHSGDVYWVDSGGLQNGDGTFTRPFLTIDTAINHCTANNGDVIIVKAGHAETLATASAITADVAGVSIIGLGSGADRPTLTFSDTAATVVVSAASVTIQNIITKPSIDSVVSPIVVSGADCWLDIEHQDASAAIEAVAAILTTAGADRLHVDLKYRGFIAGNACVNAVRLVGVDTGDINVDFYGVASTAIVEFHTTACHNITVSGNHYNSGTTDLSKNVVDTVGGSTWSVSAYDSAAGQSYSGGSAVAVAGDDVGAVAAAVAVIDGFHDVPTADVVTNAQMRDVIGNKEDAAVTTVGTTKSVTAYAKGLLNLANTGNGTTFVVSKTVTASAIVAAGVDLTGVSSGGAILIEDVVIQNAATQMDSAANGATLEIYTDNVAGSGSFVTDAEANLLANVVISGATHTTNNKVVLETGKKVTVKATGEDFTSAGNVTFHIVCRRLADSAALSAA